MTTASHLIKKLDKFAELLCYFNSFAAFLGASVGVQFVFVSVMTTRTSFPQRGQRISTLEPLSPLHNLYPHIGQDAYIFIFALCFLISVLFISDSSHRQIVIVNS